MDNITQFIDFLKSRRTFQQRKEKETKGKNPEYASKHALAVETYSQIISWFEDYLNNPRPTAPTTTEEDLFSLNPLDMNDLPEDFIKELNITRGDEQDAQVIELLKIANRPLDLNELLVGCLRKYKVPHKRNLLTARLYRLAKREEIHIVGKGTYALGPDPEGKTPTEDPSFI